MDKNNINWYFFLQKNRVQPKTFLNILPREIDMKGQEGDITSNYSAVIYYYIQIRGFP